MESAHGRLAIAYILRPIKRFLSWRRTIDRGSLPSAAPPRAAALALHGCRHSWSRRFPSGRELPSPREARHPEPAAVSRMSGEDRGIGFAADRRLPELHEIARSHVALG